jgi:hypothetical protein
MYQYIAYRQEQRYPNGLEIERDGIWPNPTSLFDDAST